MVAALIVTEVTIWLCVSCLVESTRTAFTCNNSNRSFHVMTYQSLSSFTVNLVNASFSGECRLNVSLDSSHAPPVQTSTQRYLIIEINRLQSKVSSSSSCGTSELFYAYVTDPKDRTNNFCPRDGCAYWYLRAKEPLVLYWYLQAAIHKPISYIVTIMTIEVNSTCQVTCIQPDGLLASDHEQCRWPINATCRPHVRYAPPRQSASSNNSIFVTNYTFSRNNGISIPPSINGANSTASHEAFTVERCSLVDLRCNSKGESTCIASKHVSGMNGKVGPHFAMSSGYTGARSTASGRKIKENIGNAGSSHTLSTEIFSIGGTATAGNGSVPHPGTSISMIAAVVSASVGALALVAAAVVLVRGRRRTLRACGGKPLSTTSCPTGRSTLTHDDEVLMMENSLYSVTPV